MSWLRGDVPMRDKKAEEGGINFNQEELMLTKFKEDFAATFIKK